MEDQSNQLDNLDHEVTATQHHLDKFRLSCEVERERIRSLTNVQRYCLLVNWLAAIASMLLVFLLFGMAVYFDDSKVIDGWHIVWIAAILFVCVTLYGAFMFRAGLRVAIERKGFDVFVNQL